MSYYFAWRPYISVAEKRRNAERELAKLKRRGQSIAPVRIEGRKIARSFWGQAWCANLERYSDYENWLPRGRSYVRNGSVVDLQVGKGEVAAMVAGSELYKAKVSIAPVAKARWKSICRDCTGSIDSLIELLQGRLAKGVMDRVCREGDGLFERLADRHSGHSVPDPRRFVPRRSDDAPPVGTKCSIFDNSIMAYEGLADRLSGRGVPDSRRLVARRSDDALPVGAERRARAQHISNSVFERLANRLAGRGWTAALRNSTRSFAIKELTKGLPPKCAAIGRACTSTWSVSRWTVFVPST